MAPADTHTWEAELDRWLAPFLELLGDVRRRPWLPAYLRGLLSPSERKRLTPLATHLAGQDATAPTRYHHLQQFITYSTWDVAPVLRLLAQRTDAMLGRPDAVLIVDDTTLRKQGIHSVGVAHQYCGEIGKLANCQCLVSLTLARDDIPVPLALRLYLPLDWTAAPERCAAAGVPAAERRERSKVQLALEEIARVRAAGVRFGLVTADAAYGTSAPFRHALSAWRYRYAVGVQSHLRVYPVEATAVYPPRRTRRRSQARRPGSRLGTEPYPLGRIRVRPVASEPSRTVAEMLRGATWRRVTWREGSKGPLHGRWAMVRVRVADSEPGRKGEHMPGEIVWLVGEQRPDGTRRYSFTNHPAITAHRTLVRAIRSRWACEQAHLQLKPRLRQELGLDHFEGRRWRGLVHHTTLTLLAFAFLQHLRLRAQRDARHRRGRGKKTAPPQPVAHTPRGPACPHCQALLGDAVVSALQAAHHLSSHPVRNVH